MSLKTTSPERYLSPQIAALEQERMWPKVWLMAGRLEQVADVGDFVTLDVANESILVVRTSATEIRGFFNVCQHRGRRLKNGNGNTGRKIQCPFHGWQWDIEGNIQRVVNREDYEKYEGFCDEALSLRTVKVDSWAGWIFVSMNPQIEPLLEYLKPIPEIIQHYEFENCRISWGITVTFPCNWKTALNAFNENYHVETTHAQLNKYGLSKAPARAWGKHAQFLVESAAGSSNLGSPEKSQFADLIATIEYREEERARLLAALVSEYSLTASKRLRDAVPAGATPAEIVAKYRELHRREMEAAGAKWPDQLTAADIARAGIDWHVFPNFIFLPSIDGALFYRSRPHATDPEQCYYDIWWMQRYGEGKAPEYEHRFFSTLESAEGVNAFLQQDFSNMRDVQKGMHSRGFRGCLYNPVQEVAVANFERALDEYLTGAP
jgi:phenylpropionate dioxygenase-like ring-hydroxylating dioxygenase large terminal subunit